MASSVLQYKSFNRNFSPSCNSCLKFEIWNELWFFMSCLSQQAWINASKSNAVTNWERHLSYFPLDRRKRLANAESNQGLPQKTAFSLSSHRQWSIWISYGAWYASYVKVVSNGGRSNGYPIVGPWHRASIRKILSPDRIFKIVDAKGQFRF